MSRLVPKIHKPTIIGRPIAHIVAMCLRKPLYGYTTNFNPFSLLSTNTSLTLIKDLLHLPIPLDAIIFTFYVETLYTCIPITEGIQALKSSISNHLSLAKENFIIKLAHFILTYNYLASS